MGLNMTKKTAKAAPPPPAPAAEPDDIDFRIVDITDVSANDYNPNDMEVEYFETLVATVKAEGMAQPVLVRPDPAADGKFIVVDGEHRFKALNVLGKPRIPVVVVPYSEAMAKIRTLSMNNIRGTNIPIRLAKVLVDLQKTYTDREIRAMTGISEDDQLAKIELLAIPEYRPDDGVRLKTNGIDRPVQVNLMLSTKEADAYTTAMKKAMNAFGDDVVALTGQDVKDYDKAMKAGMGIVGVKMRNVALAVVCGAFNAMPEAEREKLVKRAHEAIYDKLADDAEKAADKKAKSGKKIA